MALCLACEQDSSLTDGWLCDTCAADADKPEACCTSDCPVCRAAL